MSGPTLIGPFALTPGTPIHVQMSAETQAVYVQNYSRYTVLVSFSDTQPTATDSLNNQYDGVLQAGGRDVFYVQSRGASAQERRLNAIGAFTGSVWFMPIDRTSAQASTGSVSQINDLWVSAYGPYDPPPPFPGGMPVSLDLVSQPRVVVVPMSLSHFYVNTWNGVGTSLVATLIPTATQLAAGFAPIYLYYANVIAGSATGTTTFAIQLQWQNGGGGSVGSPFVFCEGKVWANATNNTATQWEFRPGFPLGAVGPMPGGAAQAAIQIANLGGTPITVAFTIAVGMDGQNISAPREIGVAPYNGTSQPLF